MRLAGFAASLAVAGLFVAGPVAAGAQPVPVASAAPPCVGLYAASVTGVSERGGVHVANVTLARVATPAKKLKLAATPAPSPPCVVAGFPALAFASAPNDALVTAHLSLESSATLAMDAPVSFVVEYDGAPPNAKAPPCALLLRSAAGATAAPVSLPDCGTPTQIAVSSYTPGPQPELGVAPPAAGPAARTVTGTPLPASGATGASAASIAGTAAVGSCRPSDLVPRVASAVTAAGQSTATIAVQNRTETACDLPATARIALLEAGSREIAPLSVVAPGRPASVPVVRLAPGREASARLDFTSRGDKAACATTAGVALALGNGVFTAETPAAFVVCAPNPPTRSPFRAGVPLHR